MKTAGEKSTFSTAWKINIWRTCWGGKTGQTREKSEPGYSENYSMSRGGKLAQKRRRVGEEMELMIG